MSVRRPAKSATAFRTISEVSADLGVPQHVLRFWESRFPQIRPLKRAGGRRYYRPEDIDLLRRIQSLLHGEGYTIRGVQRLMRDGRAAFLAQTAEITPAESAPPPPEPSARPAAQPDPHGQPVEDIPLREPFSDHARQEIALVIKELKALRALFREPAGKIEISLI